MRGRPPVPRAIKILNGNPGKRPLREDEPAPDLGAEAPAFILADTVLRAEWERHAARLTRYGILTATDDDALAALCVLSVKFRAQVQADAPSPVLIETSKELRQLWARFGMTPADRTRVKVSKAAPESKLARYRNGKGTAA